MPCITVNVVHCAPVFVERQSWYELLEDRHLLAADLLASIDSQIPFSSRPREILTAGNHAFFQADFSFGGGNQLWRTDGTSEGTISLNQEGLIREYLEVDGRFVWLAADQTIRASDGTPQGTTILATESTLGDVSTQLVKHGAHAFFAGQSDRGDLILYRTDGTPAGTQVFADLSSIGSVRSHQLIGGPGDFFYFNVLGQPRFAHAEMEQLWRTDGTAAGTELVSADHRFERIGPVVEFNGALLFVANLVQPVDVGTDIKGDINGDETMGFPDFLILSAKITTIADFSSANIIKLVPHETGVYVETWSTGATVPVVSIWSSDGASSGTIKLLESNEFSSIKELHRAANSLFFVGSHAQLGYRLWGVPLPVIGDVNGDMIANHDDIDAIFAAARDGSDDDRFDPN